MAIPENIEQLANDIRTKIYGREVREALASGIEAAGSIANDADVRSQETETKQTSLEKKYDEQIANMSLENPSVAEVVDARVSGYDGQKFDTIGKRMDKVDAQLAETLQEISKLETGKADMSSVENLAILKADKSYVDQKTQAANLQWKMSFKTVSDLQTAYPNGDDYNHVVLSDGFIYTYYNGEWTNTGISANARNLADNTVTIQKTTFIDESTNKFDKSTLLNGYYVNGTNGVITEGTDFYLSDFIYVKGQSNITIKYARHYAFYDAERNYVSGENLTGGNYENVQLSVPSNASYIRFSMSYSFYTIKATQERNQLNYGETLLPYEPFYVKINNLKVQLDDGSIDTNKYKNMSITPEKLTFPIPETFRTKNLFNKSTITPGYYVDQTTGELGLNPLHISSDFIPVKENTEYFYSGDAKNGLRFAYYKVDKQFLSGESYPVSLPITTPSEAAYLRFSVAGVNVDTIQLEEGAVATDYEPYGVRIKDLILDENESILNLTDNVYGTVGIEFNIYFQNLLKEKLEDYHINVISPIGKHLKDRFTVNPTTAGTFPITIEVFDKANLVERKTTNLIISNPITTPKKVLLLGDSTVITKGFGHVTQRLIDNLGDNIELVGTMGTAPNLYEGRGGWTAAKYRTNDEYQGVVNPFYNPDKADFDFGYYMNNNGFSDVDVVIINLGINDTFSYTSDLALESVLSAIQSDFDTIISSILEYDPNIKVAWNVTIPPNENQDTFGDSYGTTQTQWRYKYNNFIWVKEGIDYFKPTIDLIPIFMVLDTVNNMEDAVHPIEEGYYQIGDEITGYLNSLS